MVRFSLTVLLTLAVVQAAHAQEAIAPAEETVLYRSKAFTVTDTSVVEGELRAWAPSREELRSTYYRTAAQHVINFKFSLNERDNERPPGQDHRIRLNPSQGPFETPIYPFGEAVPAEQQRLEGRATGPAVASGRFAVTFRVNLRPVLESFEEKGYYDPPVGARIQADEFSGVYVAGDTDPLGWHFGDFPPALRVRDPDDDGIYTRTLRFDAGATRPIGPNGVAMWRPQEDLDVSAFPQYRSGQRLVDALYRLSLEEVLQNVRTEEVAENDAFPAGTFSAGAKWPGVWTRDISYSILLGLGLIAPERSKASLLAKVDERGRIIQDTGTGGSWPISTDRMSWALAAWEVYKTTGDEGWLRRAYDIIRRSAEADRHAAFDVESGLFRGESSFLDWREQSYPFWMDPRDIYLSENLGTNVVHYATYAILAKMARWLEEPKVEVERFEERAERVKTAINEHLWQPERGWYGQFRYGRHYLTRSPRAEALGASLAILRGVAGAKQAQKMAERFPVVPYGVPSFWPYLSGRQPYHNNGVWPFVTAYWGWASAAVDNRAGAAHALATLYRAAALALSNKENFVAATGRFAGTAVNSNRQLWSVAGMLSTVYRVFFGIETQPERLTFDPLVPRAYAGTRTLNNLSWRGTTLDVTLEGWGSAIERVTLDGEPLDAPAVPASLKGHHTMKIVLAGQEGTSGMNLVETRFTPRAPALQREGGRLVWSAGEEAARYRVYRNGQPVGETIREQFPLPDATPPTLAEYQVQALDADGAASFLSAPVRVVRGEAVQIVEPQAEGEVQHEGYTGEGYVVLEKGTGPLRLRINVAEGGRYALAARYANGSGPINTDNKAALRTLRVDGGEAGVLVMPQRGDGVWDDWGYSNPVPLHFSEGEHILQLVFTPEDENMNLDVNRALLDHLRLSQLE